MNLTANDDPLTMPGLLALYSQDLIIKRSMSAAVFGLILAAGMTWAFQSTSTLAPGAEAFEAGFAKWVTVGGLVLSALAVLVVAWRYLWVKKVLTRGVIVQGTVENLESHDVGGKRDSTGKHIAKHIYHATVRYEMHGRDRQVCLRLPNSGFVFGLVKGEETQLSVLDTAPEKPLLRAVYGGRR